MGALGPLIASAQLTTGVVEGAVKGLDGNPLDATTILITGGAGFREFIHAGPKGEFNISLPSGRYRFSSGNQQTSGSSPANVFVAPLQITRLHLVIDAAGVLHNAETQNITPGVWIDFRNGPRYPEGFSLHSLLMTREPSGVTEPLNFSGLSDNRISLESQRTFSWTGTQYKVQGMDVTDSWQPGVPLVLPDVRALDSVVRNSAAIGSFIGEPPVPSSNLRFWHGALATDNTGGAFSSANLPPPASRGAVQQTDRFNWFTRDGLNLGGPLTKWADVFLSATGQWASQTEPLRLPGTNQGSRLLFANARGRVRLGGRDRIEALYSGSRIDLFDGGRPTGLEALTGNRMMPYFDLPGGFSGQAENEHFDVGQFAWTHILPASSGAGILEVRYAASTAHLNTTTDVSGESRIELLRGIAIGAPPIANLAVRPRQEAAAVWQPAILLAFSTRHRITAGGGWKISNSRNRFVIPSDRNLITADGAPAFIVNFNTPLHSRENIHSYSASFADQMTLTSWLSVDLGILADFSRGSLPSQSSPGGNFASSRSFGPAPDLIVWNSASPHAGLALDIPHSHGFVVRGGYSRSLQPLAGRYLDFGNPNALGGEIYQWNAATSNVPFQPSQQGTLLVRFGGPYSTVSPTLHRPYSDEFYVGGEIPLRRRSALSIQLFRRDDRDRIAAIDTGVPASAFTPVSILDPGPDGIAGTFDDQRLTVYAQNPSTLGQDRYLLTNPAGLRMQHSGFVAEARTEWLGLILHASFVAEKSYGATNPGNGVYENDPGVIGSLFLDPNTLIHAAGRNFMDRAYVGKLQAAYRLPPLLGRIDIATTANYVDGLVFARLLLVPALPQGPFLVATTVRGSPEGGNRAQYVMNWNLRFSREFEFAIGRLTLGVDILNVTNSGQWIQENDLTGPLFNLRLPVAIQPSRFMRIGSVWRF
jgi:hypothetical protein